MSRVSRPLPVLSEADKKRFWSKVDVRGPDECWLWTACRNPKGYGMFRLGGKRGESYFAHRISRFITTGSLSSELRVLHRCDHPPCCNPGHLWLGTQADNIRDMISKNRNNPPRGDRHNSVTRPETVPRGEANGNSKLTEADIPAIRADPRVQRLIAAEYDVPQPTISAIKRLKAWKHVP